MSDNTVGWVGVILGALALIATIGLRLYDRRATHEDERVTRIKPFMLSVRSGLRGFVNAYSAESQKESADAFQSYVPQFSVGMYSFTEGLDIDLEKEVPDIKKKFDDLSKKANDAREVVMMKPEVRADTTYRIYLQELDKAMRSHPELEKMAIELLSLAEDWLRKHS